MSLSNDKALKSVAEAVSKIMEAEKKAKMDYDKDGKVESPKDEVWGSRLRAAKMAGKLKEEDTYQKDRYAVQGGKAVKDNPSHKGSANYKDQEHHVWATSSEEAMKKKMKKEDVEQLDEISKKLASSYVTKAIADKSKDRTKGLRKATSRAYKDNFYGKTNEETEQLDEKLVSLRHKSTGKELKVPLSSVGSYKTGGYTPVSPGSIKESELDEAFPSVEDAKKRMDANKSKFEKTKTNTGTVYKRKMEDEKKEVKESLSFTEMLELYNEHGLKVLAPIETEEIEIEGNTIEVIDADKINGYVETVVEEADEKEFNDNLEKNKAKASGKAKQPDLAKGDVQAVKNEEFEQLDELSDKTLTSYVNKRRAQGPNPNKAKPVNRALAKSLSKRNTWQKEETEQLDELSKSTLQSYAKKANADAEKHAKIARSAWERGDKKTDDKHWSKFAKRAGGAGQAEYKASMKKEETELDERHLTSAETKKKEEYAKSMKKGLSGFRQRYGDRAKEVMYATATKMAKKD